MKKRLLFITLILAATSLAAVGQGRFWGYHAGAMAQVSEINAITTLSTGIAAGISNGRLSFGIYGMRNLQPAQSAHYESTLIEYGLQAAYLYPLSPKANLSLGLKGGKGEAEMEAIYDRISEGTQQENIWALSPEAGLEVPMGRHLSLAFHSGYRWVLGAQNLEDVSCGGYSSIYSTLSLRLGFFPGR